MNKVSETGIADAIYQKVIALPHNEQAEVLNYVNYISFRARQDDLTWMSYAIQAALRGIEDDEWPDYGLHDLQERWACNSPAK